VLPSQQPSERARQAFLSWERSPPPRLRATVSGYVLTAASALIAVVTFDDKVNHNDLPLTILITAVGLFGMLFAATYTERYHRNRNRASQLLKEMDCLINGSGERQTGKIAAKADRQTFEHRRFRYVRAIASSHWLWVGFPAIVFRLFQKWSG
jgi:hypothetical protein